jgi:hypothetical protein
MSKPLPPQLYPWYRRATADIWTWISWPWQARTLKRHGFTRTGWMTYELGPDDVCPGCGISSCLDDAELGGGFD